MYAQIGGQVREIIRSRPSQAFAQAVWWCPFCDTSNQLKQDNLGGPMPCGKCGAVVLLKAPEPSPAPTAAPPPHDAPQPRIRGIGPSRMGRR